MAALEKSSSVSAEATYYYYALSAYRLPPNAETGCGIHVGPLPILTGAVHASIQNRVHPVWAPGLFTEW
ncbi:hypothetical protein BBBOND_0304680 [Babesia bigemina]|uniref:Uncharacterized protein n=1 Tax=Babesia bigemina TaxID=5866 RepID=A0A061DDT8_BABBI|nr:hypothetical protein BBBOND_0304680 [Babesia bigemina]CDR96565.1 hypothetical protein BBBOND_0304680 [Babesia bigemina]|eukprot:XP_012768751.1 hypothetical protein BBBOND_0304680 [Babesia bigemina]